MLPPLLQLLMDPVPRHAAKARLLVHQPLEAVMLVGASFRAC